MKPMLVKAKEIYPQSLTILPTYRCNAECTECCFESNPRIKQRLGLEDITRAIDDAKATFPALQLIVFSGGEAFLLKDDLFIAIRHARDQGLLVRCVTNAFWGKTQRTAQRTVAKLLEADVSEINISTGSDHQEHVPLESIEHACEALVQAQIVTLLTVEKDSPQTNCLERARSSAVLKFLLQEHPRWFTIQCNSWMPFHKDYIERGEPSGLESLNDGCNQVFSNLVVTPYAKLAACCGLTFEHIPEMTLGDLRATSMSDLFDTAVSDFLKIWIHIDGPGTILRKLFGSDINDELKDVRHICQACAILHLHPKVRTELRARYLEFVPDVMARFALKLEVRVLEKHDLIQILARRQPTQLEVENV